MQEYLTSDKICKNATGVDTSQFAKKDGLTNLKSYIDKMDIDELEKAPNSLNSLKRQINQMLIN